MTERIAVPLLCLALVVGGTATWWVRLQPGLDVDVEPLAQLPTQAGPWRALDVPIEDDVADELAADFNVQRDYVHPTGARAWVYIGYYSTARGGRPEHTPRSCYTGAGWALVSTGTRALAGGGDVEEYEVERDGRRRLVHFWYRTHRSDQLTDPLALSLDHLIGRLTTGRADGALVRLSTRLAPGEDPLLARSRLDSLRAELTPQIAQHWPRETRRHAQDAGDRPASGTQPARAPTPAVD